MKLPRWNYLRDYFLILLQGVLLAVFAYPWLQLAAAYWGFKLSNVLLWVFVTAVVSMAVVEHSTGRGRRGLVYLAVCLFLMLILALLGGLPLVLVIPLVLMLLYAGARFTGYAADKSFTFDWGWSTLLLLIALLLKERLEYNLGFPLVFLYVVLGITAIILWNAKTLEDRGLSPGYGGLSRFIPLFVLGATVVSGLLGLALSPSLLRQGINFLRLVYHGLVEVLFFLFVKPFAWLMSPLFRWAERQEFSRPMSPLEEFASERLQGETVAPPSERAAQVAASVGWVVLVIILLLVTWLVLRRILRQTRPSTKGGMVEERQSVFSGEEVLRDLKRGLRNLVRPLAKLGRTRWYRGDDPILVIRAFYARFITGANKKVAYRPGFTPEEYGREYAARRDEVDQQALQSLTRIYNEARYGAQGDAQAVRTAEQAFSKLRR